MRTHHYCGLTLAVVLAAGCGGGSGVNAGYCGDDSVGVGEECDGADMGGATCESLSLGGGDLACDTECRYVVRDCDVQADCGNGTAEYPEECDTDDLSGVNCEDLGFSSGPLACTSECSYDTAACVGGGECGNDELEAGEECDGADLGGDTCASLGLGGGSLDCSSDCHYDVVDCDVQAECGNDGLEYPEVCDGSDLDGNGCTDVGFYGGELACEVDCEGFDTSGCVGSCGDGLINGPELCDATDVAGETCQAQGYYPGQLSCSGTCDGYDFSTCGGTCGDGQLNGPENCDGADFGTDSCADRGFHSGSLTCATNCLDIDDAACSDYCGDGVLNGPEACDGADVGGFTCSNGAEARCAGDCSEVVCNLTTVLIVEIGAGNPDWVELMNVSGGPVNLQDWVLEWNGYDNADNTAGGTLVLPDYPLPDGARVVVFDEYGGGGGAPTVNPGEIQFHDNIWWGDTPGSVLLTDDASSPMDFVRWGGPDFDPPAGMAWTDGPDFLQSSNDDAMSLSRNPEDLDTDGMGDFCLTFESWGTTNEACPVIPPPGSVLITEIDTGQPIDRIELYNNSSADVDLEDLAIVWDIPQWGGPDVTWLPPFTLVAGDYVAIIDDCPVVPGQTCPSVDNAGIHVENINWGSDTDGMCALVDAFSFAGVDFVRWGGNTEDAFAPDLWSDGSGMPPAMPSGTVIGRSSLTDTDSGDDWCVMQAATFGAANSTCQ